MKLFDGNEIVDEYGETISKEEMLKIITERSGRAENTENCGQGAWLDEPHGLVGHNKHTHKCDPDTTYDITTNADFS